MTQFNPQNKEVLTHGEALNPIFAIRDKEDAMQYKKAYVEYMERILQKEPRKDGMTAEEVVNSNIGYRAGYGSTLDRERIEELFECKHPVFGSVKENGQPTTRQAFEAGLQIGKKLSEDD
jgi:hypothetical protein